MCHREHCVIVSASIQRQQLQTDEAGETCKATCHTDHKSLASLCSVASSDSTLCAWRRGRGPDAEEVIFGTNCHNLSNKPLKISESPFSSRFS